MEDNMTEYVTLQRIASGAGYQGNILMRNTDGVETFMLMINGGELTEQKGSLRREPILVFLSPLTPDAKEGEGTPRLLTITQTVRYEENAAAVIEETLSDWQNRVFSTGCVQEEVENYIVCRSAFPLQRGLFSLSEQLLSLSVRGFQRETELLLTMITERLTGGNEA